ncbi:hypothetical protein PFICI_07514 [Pestalotiopsis fici W106-1]|uniref:Xylose isomerase-like TIM barrel domain-containing protein n=1 Tax=Pestalotiopsis fici (strain W106-1 / CGMCC3.15140) TaxID=1229662 RepID=W3X1N3_PESFW|nr:uncharacterized protein PFICI_07514 [Pestalotiopsis fici W106-1]ETS79985.1 hypothetical protein PFICI_07514 [Pestalotiopsis fici W106-1]
MGPKLANKWAVASVSLGKHSSHSLERKLQAAKDNHFSGIELVFNDLAAHASSHDHPLLESAKQIKELSQRLSLEILTLNPFKNFEGNRDTSLRERLTKAEEWFEVAVAVGTSIVQMPSQFLDGTTGDEAVIVPELQVLADAAAAHGLKIAYEAVAFAQHNALWQDSLRIVQAVDRANFGLCLDSFHIHARIWGDPSDPSGVLPNATENVAKSLEEFLQKCPKEKILYIQLSDASRLDPPITNDSPLLEGLEVRDPRLAWSRTLRPFPLESPGYFPVVEIAKTWLLDYGWEGWVSLEGFLSETEKLSNGPEVMAQRAGESIAKLNAQLSIMHSSYA